MRLIIPIVFLLLFVGCTEIMGNELDHDTKLIAKYQTLDEKLSPRNSNCSDIVNTFEKMDKYACSFKVGNYEFDIEKKFIFDRSGNLNAYWSYKSEGPLIYNIEELETDPKFLESIGGIDLNVTLSQNGKHVMDNRDTLEIEKVFPDQKLILIKQSSEMEKNARRLLFEYE